MRREGARRLRGEHAAALRAERHAAAQELAAWKTRAEEAERQLREERVNDAHDDGDGRERRALDASRWDDLTRQQSALTKAHSQRLAALQLGAKAESPGYQERRMGELGVGA